jgi:hypothetical protein
MSVTARAFDVESAVGALDTRDGSARIEWWCVRIVAGAARVRNDEHTEMAALEPMFPEDRAMFVAARWRGGGLGPAVH